MNKQPSLWKGPSVKTLRNVRKFLVSVLCLIVLGIVGWRLAVCVPVWMEEGPREEIPDPVHFAGERRTIDLGDGQSVSFRWIPAGSVFFGKKADFFIGDPSDFGKRIRVSHGFWLGETPCKEDMIEKRSGSNSAISDKYCAPNYDHNRILNDLHERTGLRFRFATLEEIAYAGASCDESWGFWNARFDREVGQAYPNAWGLSDLTMDYSPGGADFSQNLEWVSHRYLRLALTHDPADDPRPAEPAAVAVAVPVEVPFAPTATPAATIVPVAPARPVWRIVAARDGILEDGAKLEIDGREWTLPAELSLVRGATVGPGTVTLETESYTFTGDLPSVEADWDGVRETVVELD